MKRIVLRSRGEDFHASLEGRPSIWGCGDTIDAAVGDLVRSFGDLFGIEIEWESAATRATDAATPHHPKERT